MDCIFCKIIAGELPSYKVFEDEHTLAFLDINPVSPGHTLVVPKRHAKNIFDIDAGSWAAVMESVRVVSAAVEHAQSADGINLMMNNREHAGQVVDHVHVHIIPRHAGDGLRLWPHHQYKEGQAEAICTAIKTALS